MATERTILLRQIDGLAPRWRRRYEELRATMKVAEAAKQAIREYRESVVEPYLKAILEGRAFLDTAWGRRKVVGYNDDTGWALTNNTGNRTDDRSFMVALDQMVIEGGL